MSSGRQGEAAGKDRPTTRSSQPPRILVVDVHPPSWAHTCHKFCEALENVFSLACSLAGPPRIPLLSLYVIWNQQECLLPFTPVKGNFARLQICIAELRALPVEGAFQPKEHLAAQVVQDGLQQFKQYMRQGMAGAALNSSSVEITVLTGQRGTDVVRQLEAELQGTNLASLRQLQVVEISMGGFQGPSDAKSISHIGEGASHSTEEHSVVLGTDIDLQTVENDVVALEMFFKGWLHNHSTDQEHLHLLLPPGASRHSAAPRASPACLKCDVQERLLSPALLPVAYSEEDTSGPFWKAAGSGPATHRLRVIRYLAGKELVFWHQQTGGTIEDKEAMALEAGGLCESVLFGLPLIIRPTNCWQLSWDELEANQHSFQALCHCLGKREWLLLAKYEPQGAGASWGLWANSYQVLVPSDSSTLLLRSVVGQELLLPCSLPLLPAEPPKAALNSMENILNGLEVEPAYNPLNVTSHLYRALRSHLGRVPTCRPQHQRRQQSSRHPPSKARATVAPLHLAPPAVLPLFSSEEDEFLEPE